MENKWINTKDKLPPLQIPVIGIIKSCCECDHYVQIIVARLMKTYVDGFWVWECSRGGETLKNSDDILYWRKLPKMKKGLCPGYEEF